MTGYRTDTVGESLDRRVEEKVGLTNVSQECTLPDFFTDEETEGRPLWLTQSQGIREVYPNGDATVSISPSRTCDQCGHSSFVLTTVREHRQCGHIALNGFINIPGAESFRCPKCQFTADESEGFPVVGTVRTCCRCGQPNDLEALQSTG